MGGNNCQRCYTVVWTKENLTAEHSIFLGLGSVGLVSMNPLKMNLCSSVRTVESPACVSVLWSDISQIRTCVFMHRISSRSFCLERKAFVSLQGPALALFVPQWWSGRVCFHFCAYSEIAVLLWVRLRMQSDSSLVILRSQSHLKNSHSKS